jgi:hypothetical protein
MVRSGQQIPESVRVVVRKREWLEEQQGWK